jgi:predicted DNA-binding transcriptional regulator YafY
MKTNRTGRVIELLTILQSQRNYTIPDLAEILKTSQRTIFRDLKDLKESGLICHPDSKKRDLKSFLPVFALSKDEAFSLLLLLHKARHHIRLPFNAATLTATLKIESSLLPGIRQFCASTLHNISVRPAPQITMDSLDSVFSRLLDAIQRRQTLSIRYNLPFEQKDVITDLHPYHLVYAEQSWHTIGESSFHRTVHTFKLNQIKRINPLDKYFCEDKKFDLKEYFGYAWSLLREGRIYVVELRFRPEIAEDVADVQWHETQTVSFEKDGSAILRFRVDGLNEIIWWILSYGDQVEVMAPRVLRQRVVEIARRIADSSKAESTNS